MGFVHIITWTAVLSALALVGQGAPLSKNCGVEDAEQSDDVTRRRVARAADGRTVCTTHWGLAPEQNGRHFADDIFFNENAWILIEISITFVPNCQQVFQEEIFGESSPKHSRQSFMCNSAIAISLQKV